MLIIHVEMLIHSHQSEGVESLLALPSENLLEVFILRGDVFVCYKVCDLLALLVLNRLIHRFIMSES